MTLKNFKERSKLALKALVDPLMPSLAPAVAYMARSGTGTEASLRHGALPVPVHYYSPIPDIPDLDQRKVWERRSELPGINFREQEQLTYLQSLAKAYGSECTWPILPTADSTAFFLKNGSFTFGCATALHCILRETKPRRIIEIGSGNSSKIISAALKKNQAETPDRPIDYIVIDPYPGTVVSEGLPLLSKVIRERVEVVDLTVFKQLESGDILFIDSGHTVKIGGDVNYLFLEVLPRLAPGVVVHVHDIPLPYEYPKDYATNPDFRKFWTEAYLLQAFLSYNTQFEILLGMNFLMTDHFPEFAAAFPYFEPKENWANSSSFWMRRVNVK